MSLRCSRQEIESVNVRVDSVEMELKRRDEIIETLRHELETKTTKFDTASDALVEARSVDKDAPMPTDDSTSTSTMQEADIGQGQVCIQGRPGKSELIYSRGVTPSLKVQGHAS